MAIFVNELENVVQVMRNQAESPPDRYIGAFYLAMLGRISSAEFDGKTTAATLLEELLTNRQLTPTHFVNLLFRVTQFMINFSDGIGYPEGYEEPDRWRDWTDQFVTNPVSREMFIRLMLEKNTSTTLYTRYAGVKAVISALYPDTHIRAADLGCGANHGLPGISVGMPFSTFEDLSRDRLITQLVQRQNIGVEPLGIDLFDPKDNEHKAWTRWCSHYPSEVKLMPEFVRRERELENLSGEAFVQADIRNLPDDVGRFDLISALTVLYQMSDTDVSSVIKGSERLLTNNGLMLVQDFAMKNRRSENGICFNENWFSKEFSYRTMIRGKSTGNEWWEIFQWRKPRCKEVREGEDFDKFVGILR